MLNSKQTLTTIYTLTSNQSGTDGTIMTEDSSNTKAKQKSIKKAPIGFGSGAARFGKLTGHPNLDPSGLYVERPEGCNPCYYCPQPMHVIFEVNRYRKVDKDPWRYKNELEEWAKNLGYRNQNVLKQRKRQISLLGPAWHELQEPPLGNKRCGQTVCNNVGFGRTTRFKSMQNQNPGPGTYYKAIPFKAPYGPHSTRPPFEREEPCRFKGNPRKWLLAPNVYTIIDKESIAEKPNKIVSIRGPYDLFSGKRDKAPMKCTAATWPYNMKGCLETYKKSKLGVLNKTGREVPYKGRLTLMDINMCLRRPEDPSPASYNNDKPKVFVQNKRAFNSSYDKGPGYKRVEVWPGVGRYSLKSKHACGIFGQGHRHVFLSKQPRTIGARIPEPMNTF